MSAEQYTPITDLKLCLDAFLPVSKQVFEM